MKFLLNLFNDLQIFANEVKKFFRSVIVEQRLTSLEGLSNNLTNELSHGKNIRSLIFFEGKLFVVLDDTLAPLTEQSRDNLKNLVINQLIERCNETLHSVQDIPRMYRKTNREVSSFVSIIFVCQSFSSAGSYETIELYSCIFSSSANISSRLPGNDFNR